MKNDLESELITRDYLARQRTTLANERTLLSFIRTSLYFLVSGTALFEVDKLEHVSNLGYLGFVLAFSSLLIGIINYFKVKKRLKIGNYKLM